MSRADAGRREAGVAAPVEVGRIVASRRRFRVGKPRNRADIYNRVFPPMMVDRGTTDGDQRFGIHALRPAAASFFIERRWILERIHALLGRASITMPMDVYGHLFDNAEDAVAMFDKLEQDLLKACGIPLPLLIDAFANRTDCGTIVPGTTLFRKPGQRSRQGCARPGLADIPHAFFLPVTMALARFSRWA
ncbi:hypothetical protein DRV85_14115 [Rhodosalinus halophilus]|uniref:Uncharacterized protein n=1 Tax=Rhodosalinus halophilus TaxID=2259333 RepID=A0A365U5T6_9RHOB|nr:hypothetical protein [Rhodosalinus halophilus]RBI83785.1 hypothetical protein DRV85_14115 [Rhodosalinus halophilus]